jgi:prophage antirepressor-like protein
METARAQELRRWVARSMLPKTREATGSAVEVIEVSSRTDFPSARTGSVWYESLSSGAQ